MSTQKQELYNVIESLPDEFSNKVIDYIEYLKFTETVNKAIDELVIKDKEDLIKKLEKGMNDTNNGKVCSLEKAFEEVEEILAN